MSGEFFIAGGTGLSPLARGTRQAAPSGGRGFIPAGAGEHWLSGEFFIAGGTGLSPLARGTR
ncbi:hypothetical protein, partial [Escherichia coli]|uniref:hypothetical protein n=1 Tax=Escherichia coli TaxID=562 RepID=UPI001125A04D